jgi:hypothetical protein
LREYLRNTSRNTTNATACPGEERTVNKFCDCNQGRLPCTCKSDPVGQVIAEDAEQRRPLTVGERAEKVGKAMHYAAMAEDAGEQARIIAERDALQALLNERDERTDRLITLLRRWAENPPRTMDQYNLLRDETDAEINAVCQFPQSCSSACGCEVKP